ncbi:uncharacterized protein [Littorina saxatilis]|uniref:uncharacterized protein n=1 Tax=Littorina saxatilis TaxID=31220 RepID=UPI0038B4A333
MQLITMATRTVPQLTTLLLTSLYLLLTIGHAFSDDNSNSKTPTPATPPPGDQGGGRGGRGGGSSSHKNLHKIFPGADNTSLVIPDIDDYTDPELYALLIDVLEKLGVLTPETTSCYQLQKIQHKNLPPGDENSDSGSGSANAGSGSNTHSGSGSGSHSGSGSNSIGVFLYFTETSLTDSQTPGGGGNGQAISGQKVTHSAKTNNECVSQPDLIKSMDAQPLVRDAVLNDTLGLKADPPGDGSGGVNGSGEAGAGRHTGKDGGYQITEGAEEEDEKRYSGLSLTQVVVISTCSAIICIFFIVAAILRVRNYIKRQREEQLAATRPTFRSCSVRLRSLSHSNEQVRRDSQVSKLSHQVCVC